jgi:hypothetical protein
MDKLAKQLREDANSIDSQVSDELDRRIRASLESVEPESVSGRGRSARSPVFWWASSLTGVAAAVALIAVINTTPVETTQTMTEPVAQPLAIPSIRWQAETAVLTSPLEQEIEDLQSDLKKAEEAVRRDIERLF